MKPETQSYALETLRDRISEAPKVALVLGSGLGAVVDVLVDPRSVSYSELCGMPTAGVAGHAGRFVLGKHGSLNVVAMQGRVHLYEGHSAMDVVVGVELMLALGAKLLFVTNAAGGIREDLGPGELMLIEDQLNLTGHNCLMGQERASVRRFVDMCNAYDPGLRTELTESAHALGIKLHSGVYAGVLGPSYETPAEIRMLRALGADAVGMSTVLEVIAARARGVRCLGVSCITNHAAGLAGAVLDHEDVQTRARRAGPRMQALVDRWLSRQV